MRLTVLPLDTVRVMDGASDVDDASISILQASCLLQFLQQQVCQQEWSYMSTHSIYTLFYTTDLRRNDIHYILVTYHMFCFIWNVKAINSTYWKIYTYANQIK